MPPKDAWTHIMIPQAGNRRAVTRRLRRRAFFYKMASWKMESTALRYPLSLAEKTMAETELLTEGSENTYPCRALGTAGPSVPCM